MVLCVNKKKNENIVKKSTRGGKTNTKEPSQPNLLDYRKNLDMNKIKSVLPQLDEKKDIIPISPISPMTTSNKNEFVMQTTSILMKSKEIETNRVIKEEPPSKTIEQNNVPIEQSTKKEENIVLSNVHKIDKNKYEENTIENLIEDQSALEDELFKLKTIEYEPLYNFAYIYL